MKKRDYLILGGIGFAAFLLWFFRKEKPPARISDKEAEKLLKEGINQSDPSGRVFPLWETRPRLNRKKGRIIEGVWTLDASFIYFRKYLEVN